MKKNTLPQKLRKALLLSASFLLIFSACKKDGELVPAFQDSAIGSTFTDSVQIKTTTLVGDSVLADRIAIGLVGVYQDSAFGKVTSNLYMQPLLASNALIFFEQGTERFEIDSVVLSLEYTNHFGDTSIPQTFNVFRLDETLSAEDNHFSDTTINVIPTPIGTKTFSPTPNVEDTVLLPNTTGGTDTVAVDAQLRIRLDNSIGDEIIGKSGSTDLQSNDNFTQLFKGIKVEPVDNTSGNNNEAAILYFGFTASNTNMTIFYRTIDLSSGTETKKSAIFPVNSSSVRFNTFEHDYTGSAVQDVLNNMNTTPNEAYTEAMAGVETLVEFPDLVSRFKGKILVNKAELVLPVAGGSYDEFGVAETIVAAARDDNGALQFVPDAFESAEFFGGIHDESLNRYTFTITRYVQGVLNGTIPDNGLTVLVTGSAVKAERVIFLNENNTSGEKIRLNLYYTNIN